MSCFIVTKLLTCFTTPSPVAETVKANADENTTEIVVSKTTRPQTFSEALQASKSVS